MTASKSPAQRVRASEQRSIASGAVRMPGGLLPAEASVALDQLVNSDYALSKTGVIARALVEAAAGRAEFRAKTAVTMRSAKRSK